MMFIQSPVATSVYTGFGMIPMGINHSNINLSKHHQSEKLVNSHLLDILYDISIHATCTLITYMVQHLKTDWKICAAVADEPCHLAYGTLRTRRWTTQLHDNRKHRYKIKTLHAKNKDTEHTWGTLFEYIPAAFKN